MLLIFRIERYDAKNLRCMVCCVEIINSDNILNKLYVLFFWKFNSLIYEIIAQNFVCIGWRHAYLHLVVKNQPVKTFSDNFLSFRWKYFD